MGIDRLRVMHAIAARTNGQLRLFFVAHGLGEAFDRVGQFDSKANRVAAAIAEADRQGRGDAVLRQAAEHFSIETDGPSRAPASRSADRAAQLAIGDSMSPPADRARSVFISVAEHHKEDLGRPFRDLLAPNVTGFIVSDLTLIDDSHSPDEKVDAYLQRAGAVVLFATADIESRDGGAYTRPNIAEEFARARGKPHLRTRVFVLKEGGVALPSNTNPAYGHIDIADPVEGFASAVEQLRTWGFDVPRIAARPAASPRVAPTRRSALSPALDPQAEREATEWALGRVPNTEHTMMTPSVALVAVIAPRRPVLRPSELEDPAFAMRFEAEALTGPAAILDRRPGIRTAMQGNSLVIHQAGAWAALDAEGTLVIVRPLARGSDRGPVLRGIIEEDMTEGLELEMAFVDRVLAMIDEQKTVAHVVLVAALLSAGSNGWRTRAELAASPHSMRMDITGGNQIVERLSPPARPRSALATDRSALAKDLMILLRRQARGNRA